MRSWNNLLTPLETQFSKILNQIKSNAERLKNYKWKECSAVSERDVANYFAKMKIKMLPKWSTVLCMAWIERFVSLSRSKPTTREIESQNSGKDRKKGREKERERESEKNRQHKNPIQQQQPKESNPRGKSKFHETLRCCFWLIFQHKLRIIWNLFGDQRTKMITSSRTKLTLNDRNGNENP